MTSYFSSQFSRVTPSPLTRHTENPYLRSFLETRAHGTPRRDSQLNHEMTSPSEYHSVTLVSGLLPAILRTASPFVCSIPDLLSWDGFYIGQKQKRRTRRPAACHFNKSGMDIIAHAHAHTVRAITIAFTVVFQIGSGFMLPVSRSSSGGCSP